MSKVSEARKLFESSGNKSEKQKKEFSNSKQEHRVKNESFSANRKNIKDFFERNNVEASQNANESELTPLQKEYKELINKVYEGNITKLYNIDNAAGDSYAAKLEEIVNGENSYDFWNESDVKKATQAIKKLDKEVEKALKEKSAAGESPRRRSTISRKTTVASAPEPAAAAKNDVSSENDETVDIKTVDIKEVIKDGARVKSYIKSKFGSFNDINGFIGEMATKYKAKNEYMPIKDLRRIYGTKGGLMLIYRLENEGSGTKKSKSTYRKYCERILIDYRNLKVEAAVLALESGTIDVKNFSEQDAKELKKLVDEIVRLKNNVGSDEYNEVCDHFFKYCGHLTMCSLGLAAVYGGALAVSSLAVTLLPALVIGMVCPPGMIALLGGGAAIGGALGVPAAAVYALCDVDYILSEKSKMKEEEKKLKEDLKNLKGNNETKRVINKVLKMAEKLSENKITATAFKAQQDYIKKYNNFVEKSGKLAARYLSWVAKDKRDRLKNVDPDEVIEGRDLVIDAYKIIFMCLVAACSKNKRHINAGVKFFSKNKTTLSKFVK